MGTGPGAVFRPENSEKQDAAANDNKTAIPTAQDIEQWHQQAHEEAYQQGMQQAQQELKQTRDRLESLMNFFEHPLQALNDEVEQQLNLLAVTMAQQLVRRELKAEPGEIIGLIRECVQLLPASSRQIRIFLNPEDAVLIRRTLQLDSNEDEQSWKLVEDPMITRGGCEIKSDKSVINATLEKRLQALAATVLGGERIQDQNHVDAD
jgi:flagellar assembly protein FliH